MGRARSFPTEELLGPALGSPGGETASGDAEDAPLDSILNVELTGLCGRPARGFLCPMRSLCLATMDTEG